jgi:hypothetical protein
VAAALMLQAHLDRRKSGGGHVSRAPKDDTAGN